MGACIISYATHPKLAEELAAGNGSLSYLIYKNILPRLLSFLFSFSFVIYILLIILSFPYCLIFTTPSFMLSNPRKKKGKLASRSNKHSDRLRQASRSVTKPSRSVTKPSLDFRRRSRQQAVAPSDDETLLMKKDADIDLCDLDDSSDETPPVSILEPAPTKKGSRKSITSSAIADTFAKWQPSSSKSRFSKKLDLVSAITCGTSPTPGQSHSSDAGGDLQLELARKEVFRGLKKHPSTTASKNQSHTERVSKGKGRVRFCNPHIQFCSYFFLAHFRHLQGGRYYFYHKWHSQGL